MPEGHTIHRRARDHLKWFGGQTLRVSSPQGRFAPEAEQLDGAVLREAQALGKHLLYRFETRAEHALWVHIHLGLFGRFRIFKGEGPEPKGALRMRWVGDERTLDLRGPTACELMDDEERSALRARIGPDPLDAKSDARRFVDKAAKSRRAIGALLLDQKIIAGIGNVYRAELLYRAGVCPTTQARDLEAKQLRALYDDAKALLTLGVKYDRIFGVTPDEVDKPMTRLKRNERLHVYKRSRCGACGEQIECYDLGARTMWSCPGCQT